MYIFRVTVHISPTLIGLKIVRLLGVTRETMKFSIVSTVFIRL